MADPITAECTGLQISNNTFSASPPGSLLVAENVVIPSKGVAEPRRGQEAEAAIGGNLPMQLATFQAQTLLSHAATKLSTSYGLGYVNGSSITAYSGTFNPVDCDGASTAYARMKFGFAASYLHFCTTTGPKTLETYNGAPRASGLLRMPDPQARMLSRTTLTPATSAGLAYGSTRAYRTLLRKPTSSGASLLSPPSGRVVVQNRILAPIGAMTRAGGTTVTVTIPGQGPLTLGLAVGDSFTLTPGEADFAAGAYTVATVSGTPGIFTYTNAGANVSNTVAQDFDTGQRAVAVGVRLSADASTSTPFRVYRSRDTVSDAPGDEMFLQSEVLPSAGDITAGLKTINDVTPQSVTDDPLYTNPQTGQGESQANFQPPIYRDTANWGGMQFYVNTTGLQQLRLQMLGVGSPDGVQVDDTFTVIYSATTVTLTFKALASLTTEVTIVSNSTPAVNILRTAANLISALNVNFTSGGVPVRAYYESSQNGAPGKILLEAIAFGSLTFAVRASRPATWTPALQVAVDTNSQAERVLNGFAYSKSGQPEAVPPLNYSFAGSRNYANARCFGLQQALLLFKEGDGIYAVTGAPPFNVQQISTANIIAPDCACVMEDAVWVYTDQGILRVSDAGGSTVVSRPIETELNRLRALYPDETHDWAFAVPYEQERRVLFFVPFDVVAGVPQLKAWCYNAATQAWSGPLYEDAFSGVVNTDELRLKLGQSFGVSTVVSSERNDQDVTDYADFDYADSISNVDVGGNPLVIRLASGASVTAGDGIVQGVWRTRIKAERTDLGARYFELYEDVPFTAAACTIFTHYDVTVQFQPQGNPSARKTLTRLAWLFKPEWFESFTATSLVMTDQIQADLEIATPFAGFGYGGFGSGPFGNPTPLVVDVNPIKPQWTNAAQFFVGLRTQEVWMKMRLQGFVMRLETADAPVGRGG